MKTGDPSKHTRHAKVFDLLRQERTGKRPADRAAAGAARYLDDATSERLILTAVGSLKEPPTRKGAKPRAFSDLVHPARWLNTQ